MTRIHKGVIIQFDQTKGFGFIKCDLLQPLFPKKDFFFLKSCVKGFLGDYHEGMDVYFKMGYDESQEKRVKACGVAKNPVDLQQMDQPQQPTGQQMEVGTISKIEGSYGFIQQDKDQEQMFVMPKSCMPFGGQIPPIGTRVMFKVVKDSKTGRPRAEDVEPLNGDLVDTANFYICQASKKALGEDGR